MNNYYLANITIYRYPENETLQKLVCAVSMDRAKEKVRKWLEKNYPEMETEFVVDDVID
jgi:hypothetical protein